MRWGVKIFLFIGIFLLLIGLCAYGYMSYEGFQNPSTSGSFCSTNENKCLRKCSTPNTGDLPDETYDESLIYDVYEEGNLQDVINPSNPEPKTTVQNYDMASELSEFDSKAPMPWDYDNRQLDPKETVWGDIHPDVSHMLYQKAYNKAIFGSANPASFIENDNETGQNAYRSNVFQKTVYGTEGMIAITTVEAFQDFYTSMAMQAVLENLGLSDNNKVWQRIKARMDDSKPRIIGPGGIEIRNRLAPPTISWAEAAAEEGIDLNVRKNIQAEIDNVEDILKTDLPKGADGKLTPESESILAKRRKNLENIAVKEVNRGRSNAAGLVSALDILSKKDAAIKANIKKILGERMDSLVKALSHVRGKSVLRAGASFTKKYVKKMLEYVAKLAVVDGILLATCAQTVATVTAAGISTAPVTFGATAVAAGAWATAYTTACTLASLGITTIMVSLISWIPVLMSLVVDEAISLCPKDAPWNLKDAFYNCPGGEAGWEIFSAIPLVGDVSYAIGPYICWGAPGGKLTSRLKQQVKSPYYYYDPTLSIYTADKKYAQTANPLDPTQRNQITSGVFETDPEYTNHYLYKDMYGLYPFLVDFSHKTMLNKMAQFYYEMSRKNMTINYDGTGTFEYISRIYGIMSSSELSCDIQCELTEITVDILYGKKLCERIVPVPVDAPAWYHDRRFYFYVDITKGESLSTPENTKCETYLNHVQSPTQYNKYPSCLDFGSSATECSQMLWPTLGKNSIYKSDKSIDFNLLDAAYASCNMRLMTTKKRTVLQEDKTGEWHPQTRMDDNMNKYIVTGCTYVNGTAPDVYDSKNLNAEGVQVGDTPVAVGPRGNTGGDMWYPPQFSPAIINDITLLPAQPTGVPLDTSCNIARSNFTKYGTTTRTERPSEQSQTANVTNIVKATELQPWPKTAIIEWNKRDEDLTRTQSGTRINFDDVTKYMRVHWMDCPEGEKLQCEGRKRSFWMTLGVGSALGILGSYGNIGPIPAGAVLSGTFGVMGVQQYLNCLVADATISEGTFVQNGMLRTSHSGLYLIDHGPTIQYSPGYVPTIRINDPSLNMLNCANRYSVRKFTNMFSKQYTDYKLQNIFDISPRRKIVGGNQIPCCVFGVNYTQQISTGQNTVSTQSSKAWVRMDMTLNSVSDNVLVYRPYDGLLRMNPTDIPPIVPFTLQRVMPPPTGRPMVTTNNIAPLTCTRVVNCNDALLQERIFDQFNASHIGVYLDYYRMDSGIVTTAGGSQGSGSPASGSPASGSPSVYINPVIQRANLYNNILQAELELTTARMNSLFVLQPAATMQGIQLRLLNATNAYTAAQTALANFDAAQAAATAATAAAAAAAATATAAATAAAARARWQTILNRINNGGSGVTITEILNSIKTALDASTRERIQLLGFVSNAITPAPTDGITKCIFNLSLQKNTYNASNTIVPTNPPQIEQRQVTMYLKPVEDSKTDPTGCLYDLDYDDYPDSIWYKKIPRIFFDVPEPPSEINTNFKRAPTCNSISDCSSVELLKNVITQFNRRNTDKKINTVYRAFTPKVGNNAVCDYDVEMLRSYANTKTTLANQETVRLYLRAATGDICMYDLDSDLAENTNTGLSLNKSQFTGGLVRPFVWSSSFLYDIRQTLYDSVLPVLGLDVVNTVQEVSKTAKETATAVFNNSVQIQNLKACDGRVTCRDPYILKKILNRYNFQTSPAYPDPSKYETGPQYNAQERKIVEFRRAGIASPTSCHVEFIENVNTYDDFLYEAKPENRRAFLRQYKFDIGGDTCENIFIEPVSSKDIQAGKMNIEGDPYGIDSDKTAVNPTGQAIIGPMDGSSAAAVYFNYDSPVVNCVAPEVLAKVQSEYEKRDVSSTNVTPRNAAFNRIISVLEWFNPAPNVCEYKMNIQHVYFDADYGYYYSIPAADQKTGIGINTVTFNRATFSRDDTPSYVVAKWVPDTDYDIETGTLKQNRPIVDEYFYPDLSIRDGKFYRDATSTVPLNLPYLSGQGLSGVGSANPKGVDYRTQGPNFKESVIPLGELDQSNWPSCRYVPDQSLSSPVLERCT